MHCTSCCNVNGCLEYLVAVCVQMVKGNITMIFPQYIKLGTAVAAKKY